MMDKNKMTFADLLEELKKYEHVDVTRSYLVEGEANSIEVYFQLPGLGPTDQNGTFRSENGQKLMKFWADRYSAGYVILPLLVDRICSLFYCTELKRFPAVKVSQYESLSYLYEEGLLEPSAERDEYLLEEGFEAGQDVNYYEGYWGNQPYIDDCIVDWPTALEIFDLWEDCVNRVDQETRSVFGFGIKELWNKVQQVNEKFET